MAANNLRQLRTAQGLSQAKLAERAGTSAQQIDRLEKGERKLTVEWLTRLAAALDVQPHEIFMDAGGVAPAGPTRTARPAEPPPMLQKDLPVYGTALGADLEFVSLDGHPVAVEQTMLNQAETIDTIRRLPALQDERDAYAIYVQGSSMEPAFEDGDPVPVVPGRPVRPRDYVVVHLVRPNGDEGEESSAVLLKRLIRRSGSYIELEQFNPPAKFRVDATRVKAVHRVMRWAEASGL